MMLSVNAFYWRRRRVQHESIGGRPYTIPTLGPIVVRKHISFQNLLLPVQTFHPTHNDLTRCNALHFHESIQDKNSYQDEDFLIGIG